MSRPLLLLFVLLRTLMLTACVTLESVSEALEGQKPTAKVQALRLAGLDMNGEALAFDVAVDNPNPIGISLDALDYDLKLGQQLHPGRSTHGDEVGR